MNKKKVSLCIELLAKSNAIAKPKNAVYNDILECLSNNNLYATTLFSHEKIAQFLKLNEDGALLFLQSGILDESKLLKKPLWAVLSSLLKANFPNNAKFLQSNLIDFEASLDKVNLKIYLLIKSYIDFLCLCLELFIFFDEKRQKNVEDISEFAKNIHSSLIKNLFFEEEKVLLDENLSQLLVVYVGIYINFCYQKRPS